MFCIPHFLEGKRKDDKKVEDEDDDADMYTRLLL